MDKETFIKELKKIGIEVTDKELESLEKYYNLLIEWNEKINLTAITNKEDVYLKHFYDSLTMYKIVDLKSFNSLCDVGSGAGFPGLVLKIFFPNLKVDLVDSLNKRIIFLNEVIKELNLKGIEAIHSRVEDYAKNNREKYDIVTARAVTNLSNLMEFCVPITKVNGLFIPLKGSNDEVVNCSKAMSLLNITLEEKQLFNLPVENSTRIIYKFKKNQKTNIIFPRKYSDIIKKPL